eukprot:EG_transcript_13597
MFGSAIPSFRKWFSTSPKRNQTSARKSPTIVKVVQPAMDQSALRNADDAMQRAAVPCVRRRTDGTLGICCAFDGSDISTRALEATALFTTVRDEVHALYCAAKDADPKEEGRCKAIAVDCATRRQLPNFKFLSKELGSPKDVAQALADYGDRQQCGLICTGTRHRVEGDKRAVGRITDALVRCSYIPVCVIRPGVPKKEGRRYLVAIDGSALALKSVEFILTLARASDEVYVFTINDERSGAEGALKDAQSVMQQTATLCKKVDVVRVARDRSISVAENIIKVVNEQEGDFIVLSTGWKRRDELGSTSTYCIYHADCNLLIYKNQAHIQR